MFAVRIRALIALIAMLAHATVPGWHFAGCFGWHSAIYHFAAPHCAQRHSHDGHEHLGSCAVGLFPVGSCVVGSCVVGSCAVGSCAVGSSADAQSQAQGSEDSAADEIADPSFVSETRARAGLDAHEKQGTWIESGATGDGHDCPLCDVGFSVSWSSPIRLWLWDESHPERLLIGDRSNGSWLVGEGFTIRGPPVLS